MAWEIRPRLNERPLHLKVMSGMWQVGRRRRARRTPLSDGRGTIPLERSLVPIRVHHR